MTGRANNRSEIKTLMYSAISPDSTEQKEKASTYREIREAGVAANHHSPGKVSALYAKGATFAYNRVAIV